MENKCVAVGLRVDIRSRPFVLIVRGKRLFSGIVYKTGSGVLRYNERRRRRRRPRRRHLPGAHFSRSSRVVRSSPVCARVVVVVVWLSHFFLRFSLQESNPGTPFASVVRAHPSSVGSFAFYRPRHAMIGLTTRVSDPDPAPATARATTADADVRHRPPGGSGFGKKPLDLRYNEMWNDWAGDGPLLPAAEPARGAHGQLALSWKNLTVEVRHTAGTLFGRSTTTRKQILTNGQCTLGAARRGVHVKAK